MKHRLIFIALFIFSPPLSYAHNVAPLVPKGRTCSGLLSILKRPNPLRSAYIADFSDYFIPQKPRYTSHKSLLRSARSDFSRLYIYHPAPNDSQKPSFGKMDPGRWIHFNKSLITSKYLGAYIVQAHSVGPKELRMEHNAQHHAKLYTYFEFNRDLVVFFDLLSIVAKTQTKPSLPTAFPNLKFALIEPDLVPQMISVLENWQIQDKSLFDLKQQILNLMRSRPLSLWNLNERDLFFRQFFNLIETYLQQKGFDSERISFIYNRFFYLD